MTRADAAPPVPGLVWGRYPQRTESALGGGAAPGFEGVVAALRACGAEFTRFIRFAATGLQHRRDSHWLDAVRSEQQAWAGLQGATRTTRLAELRASLARHGWSGAGQVLRTQALACAASAGAATLGRDAFDCQLLAAAVLLDGRFAEMATGEGKTYAAALAAAVAALAGVPVHVMTANDYLVQRDSQALTPFYGALGLSVGAVTATSAPDARRAAYACDVTYCTAREVAFDYLRDGLGFARAGSELQQRSRSLAGAPCADVPLLRGLCMALLDEADSLLIDDASTPLVLSQQVDDPQHRAACFQALALARRLQPGVDFVADDSARRIDRLAPSEQRLEQLAEGLNANWRNRRHRDDMVSAALEALHLHRRDRDYIVRDGRVELLDSMTGRAAPGRVWSRGVHTLVELKEGCAPSRATVTRAQISFQRFFARYWLLCGTSGTLRDAAAELFTLYRRSVVAIPLRRPSARLQWRDRVFVDSAARWRAVARRAAELQAQGRPILIGTDSVADSEALSAVLAAAGLAHQVLNARNDQAEAEVVATAGGAGVITVATRMAGRGTDIELGPGVAACGGLHVVCCQANPSPRLDRQLIGRAARQGDPGSAEAFHTVDGLAQAHVWPSGFARLFRKQDDEGAVNLPAWLLRACARKRQRECEARQIRQRRRLLEQDREWEQRMGLVTRGA